MDIDLTFAFACIRKFLGDPDWNKPVIDINGDIDKQVVEWEERFGKLESTSHQENSCRDDVKPGDPDWNWTQVVGLYARQNDISFKNAAEQFASDLSSEGNNTIKSWLNEKLETNKSLIDEVESYALAKYFENFRN